MSSKKFSPRIVLALLLIGLSIGYYFLKGREPASIRTENAEPAPQVSARPAQNAVVPTSHVSPRPSPSHRINPNAQEWGLFKSKFGDDLTAEFTGEGRLSSLRGMINGGKRAAMDFRVNDPQKDIARAREVIDAASGLLGIAADLPLEKPIARPDPNIAQVLFREAFNGVPVYPVGNVTLDLGPQGEVIGLYSNYVPDLKVSNSVQLDSELARKAAESAVPEPEDSNSRTEGGAQIIWLNPGDAPTQARYAYEFNVRGRQVIVDAETGKVIANKDRRRF